MSIHNPITTNNIIYKNTSHFKNSVYCKNNIGKNGQILNQNNTGIYFEDCVIKPKLNNVQISLTGLTRLDGSTYKQDIETLLSIISCKVQEGPGTAWQKLGLELMDLEHATCQTNKQVILLYSNYSWDKYFYKLLPYFIKINKKVIIMKEQYFFNNIKLYD